MCKWIEMVAIPKVRSAVMWMYEKVKAGVVYVSAKIRK